MRLEEDQSVKDLWSEVGGCGVRHKIARPCPPWACPHNVGAPRRPKRRRVSCMIRCPARGALVRHTTDRLDTMNGRFPKEITLARMHIKRRRSLNEENQRRARMWVCTIKKKKVVGRRRGTQGKSQLKKEEEHRAVRLANDPTRTGFSKSF